MVFKNIGRKSKCVAAMQTAILWSQCSEDPYTKVGACVLRKDKTVASIGFNGAPPGVNIDWADREEKNKRAVHAEPNVLSFLDRREEYFALFLTHTPCERCLSEIALYKFDYVYYNQVYHRQDENEIIKLAKEQGVKLRKFSDYYAESK